MSLFDTITNEDIQKLPLKSFEGNIHIIDKQQECGEAIAKLQSVDELGFDTETKPSFVKGQHHSTAIIQLSTLKEAFLFRLKKIPNTKPVFSLLEDSAVVKLGIGIAHDLKDLMKIQPFIPQNFLDLNDTARTIGIQHIGVRKLAALCLKYRISKKQQVSNWENEELTDGQQRYAATDAWVCLAIQKNLRLQGYID